MTHTIGVAPVLVGVISLGAAQLGALLGGAIGDRYGLRATVLVAGIGTLAACLWIVASPVRRLRAQPPMEDA